MENFSENDKEFLRLTQKERSNLESAGNPSVADGVKSGLGKVYDEAEGLTSEAFAAAMPKITGNMPVDLIYGTEGTENTVKKYRKKPVVIEAIKLTQYSIQECYDFIDDRKGNFQETGRGIDPSDGKFKITTLEGVMIAEVGDYIIKGVKGEFYPCKPDIFAKTYDLEEKSLVEKLTHPISGRDLIEEKKPEEEVFRLLEEARNLVGNPGTNISSSTDFACEKWHRDYNAWKSARGTDTCNKDIFPMDRERLLVLLSVSLNINFSPTTKDALATVYNNLFHDGYLSKSETSGVWHLSFKGENYLGELVANQNLFESKMANDVAKVKTYPKDNKPDLYELAYESYHMLLELTEKKDKKDLEEKEFDEAARQAHWEMMVKEAPVEEMYERVKSANEELLKVLKLRPDFPIELLSDGYHTFKELYEFRLLYNAAFFNNLAGNGTESQYSVHKSWKHNDGELCFNGGWFIVSAMLPEGQISNHYKAEYWDYFKVPEVEKALFEFDGHTSEDVQKRLTDFILSEKSN